MPNTLQTLTPSQIPTFCFLPNHSRQSEKFQPDDDAHHHSQIYDANSFCDYALAALKASPRSLTPRTVAQLKSPTVQLQVKRDLVEEHVDRRVQLFFQQAILCHKTPFYYEASGAEDQIGSGQSLKVKSKAILKTQAAHSSTFPCLYASLRDEDGDPDPSTQFVFLKHSAAYRSHNATVELPDYVNKTDTRLDGKTSENKLRARSLKLINRCASGSLDPVKATRLFLKIFIEESDSLADALGEDDPRKQVAEIYRDHARGIKEEIQGSDEIFDRIMGVKLCEGEDEGLLREIVYRRRFTLIQQAEFIHSQIAKKVFKAQAKIFGTKISKIKSVDFRLRFALLKQFSGQSRRTLEKLFCVSLEQLSASAVSRQKLRSAHQALSDSQKKKIAVLSRDLRALFSDLQRREFLFRAELFKDLRTRLKDWTQGQFSARYRRAHPHSPMSQAMVSRLEQPTRVAAKAVYATPLSQRCKDMTVQKARNISSVFGIDPGLFLPSLFTSEE